MHIENPNNKVTLLAREKIDLQEYIFTLKRHKFKIFGFATFVVIVTAIIVYSITPVYKATATLHIDAQQAKIVSIEELYGLESRNAEYYETQFEIMKSRELVGKVIERLDLINHPEYAPKQKSSFFNLSWPTWFPFDKPDLNFLHKTSSFDTLTYEEINQDIIEKFLTNLKISPIKNTQLVDISFEAHDRTLAAEAANTLADVYIESHLDAKLQMTKKATSWLMGRMDSLKKNLAESETNLQEFREKEGIIKIKGIQTVATQNLNEINTKLVSAREQLATAENLFNQVNSLSDKTPEAFESIPAVLKNNLVESLKKVEADEEQKLAELSKRYGPQHPKIAAAKSRLDSTKSKIQDRIAIVVAGIEKEFEIAKKNERALRNSLEKTKQQIQEINRKEFQLRELERDVETSRKLYDTFFNRFQETNATGDLQTVNARIMDRAVAPRKAAKPQKAIIIIAVFIMSLVIGVMRALFKEHLGNTFRSTEDVESKLGIPSLGILPLTKTGHLKQLHPLDIFSRSEYFALAESIRTIRTGLILSDIDEPKKVVLVTSSVPNEGKTTLSIGLAMALGQVEKVLLIDADLRHPSLTKYFDLPPNAPGVSTLVTGTEKLDSCIHSFRKVNIDLLPSGLIPPNPLELLSSKRFKSMLEELQKRYDRIVIDSAPTQAVSDALLLSSHAQSVIYMVKADSTARHVAFSGIKRLLNVNAPLRGVVLNQLDVIKASKFGNYEYYHDKRYGQYGNTPTLVKSKSDDEEESPAAIAI